MELTIKQQKGLRTALDRFHEGKPYTVISGYAGSGKSTLIKFIIAALGLKEEEVAYVAFTGKAANVLKQKGCPNATTAHKLLYKAKPMPDGSYIFIKKDYLDDDYKIIVVDEVSMLPAEMWQLLLSHKVYVLACGDPEQLPPINPEDDNHVLDYPHIFLNEIMRQAQESEIIRLSMHVREGKPISTFKASGQQVQILNQNQLVSGLYEWPDQILCATNQKRNEINNIVRALKGYDPNVPNKSDKIISLRNHWDYFSNEGVPLTNGAIGNLTDYSKQIIRLPYYISGEPLPILVANIITEDGEAFNGVPIDYTALTTGQKLLTSQQEYRMLKNQKCMDPPFEFAYGYAITCWKAQGSEWNKVVLFEENFPWNKEEHRKFLYTGITRASQKLVLVTKN